jgi:hypothetical protein
MNLFDKLIAAATLLGFILFCSNSESADLGTKRAAHRPAPSIERVGGFYPQPFFPTEGKRFTTTYVPQDLPAVDSRRQLSQIVTVAPIGHPISVMQHGRLGLHLLAAPPASDRPDYIGLHLSVRVW